MTTNQTTKTISGVKIKPFRYQFGSKRKKIYDLKKERGEVFEHTVNGETKTYICDGFLPSDNVFKTEKNGNPSGAGIYCTEIHTVDGSKITVGPLRINTENGR